MRVQPEIAYHFSTINVYDYTGKAVNNKMRGQASPANIRYSSCPSSPAERSISSSTARSGPIGAASLAPA